MKEIITTTTTATDRILYVDPSTSFGATYKMFAEYLGYNEESPLSYDDWMKIPDDRKTAVLYVQFYPEITLAWSKTKTDAATEEAAVETVIQYLMKNTPKIENNPNRFKPGYIYKVAYNCLYCVSIDPYKGQTAAGSWYNNTQSPYITVGDDELDLFDYIPDGSNRQDTFDSAEFWAIIESMGEDTLSVVAKLLGDNSKGTSVIGRNLACRREVSDDDFKPRDLPKVSKKDQINIIEELKVKLAKFAEIYYI